MEPKGDKAKRIELVAKVLEVNERLAEENRKRFADSKVYVVDIIGSPGAGKTALLESSIPKLKESLRVGVITGDISTMRDAERLAVCGVPVVQLTTDAFGGACHLDANMIKHALDKLSLDDLDLLFIENVGNLVCPAEFDIGHSLRVVVLSVAEGEDKPLKYPLAFRAADLAVVSKIDLVPHLKMDMAFLRENLGKVNPGLKRIELSAISGEGVDSWADLIRAKANWNER